VNAPDIRALTCPKCGAAISLRTGAQAQVVVCDHCLSVLDAQDPNLKVLQHFAGVLKVKPLIPLGSKGNFKGDPYEVVGFQVRTIKVDGSPYSWREYLLWNPYKGYRYLSEYDYHWNDITVIKTPPQRVAGVDPPAVVLHGETFKHFQTASATTTFVLGEFPWEVRVGDVAEVSDYVAPPNMLSSEKTNDETTWSYGTYTPPKQIWAAFGLTGSPPEPSGVFENQPDDAMPAARAQWKLFGVFAVVLLALYIGLSSMAREKTVFAKSFRFDPPGADSSAYASEIFPIDGGTSNVQVTIQSDVSNSWAFFDLALINDETGKAVDFGREVSYYYGSDEDGPWTEGSQDDISYLPSIPPGRYYLRVQPEGPANGPSTHFTISLKRDVPRASWFWLALFLLIAAPLGSGFAAWAFESQRWKESDHPLAASVGTGDGSDSSDDDS